MGYIISLLLAIVSTNSFALDCFSIKNFDSPKIIELFQKNLESKLNVELASRKIKLAENFKWTVKKVKQNDRLMLNLRFIGSVKTKKGSELQFLASHYIQHMAVIENYDNEGNRVESCFWKGEAVNGFFLIAYNKISQHHLFRIPLDFEFVIR